MIRSSRRLLLSLAAAVLFCFAFAGLVGAQAWTEFRSTEWGFQVKFPGKLEQEDQTVRTNAGPVVNHIFGVRNADDTEAFQVQVADFPALASVPVETSLDNLARGQLGADKKVRNRQNVVQNGLPARRQTMESNDGALVADTLVVRKGNRVYQVIHVVSPKLENRATIDQFFKSFALID